MPRQDKTNEIFFLKYFHDQRTTLEYEHNCYALIMFKSYLRHKAYLVCKPIDNPFQNKHMQEFLLIWTYENIMQLSLIYILLPRLVKLCNGLYTQ